MTWSEVSDLARSRHRSEPLPRFLPEHGDEVALLARVSPTGHRSGSERNGRRVHWLEIRKTFAGPPYGYAVHQGTVTSLLP